MRQMSYSVCRFWAYDESKKLLGADNQSPAWKLALAGSMGAFGFLVSACLCTESSVLSWWNCRSDRQPWR